MTEFYTYRIKWSKTDISYYGVRYKDNGTVADLMNTYFTSSKYVSSYIKEHGLPDIIQVRKLFKTALEAKQWEDRVIIKGKLAKSAKWLNAGNNGSFKNITMTPDIREKIGNSNRKVKASKGKSKIYNNGVISKFFYEGDIIPENFNLGRLITPKIKAHIDFLNNRPIRQETRDKISKSTKGKKKPEGFGDKISKSTKGRINHWAIGDKNVSKRQDVRDKISKSWETRRSIIWFTNKITGENVWQYSDEAIKFDLEIWRRGKTIEKSGGYIICTNGILNKRCSDETQIPSGWWRGRS